MAIFSIRAIQGAGDSWTITLNPPAAFQGTETLAATVSSGGTAAAILSLTPTWAAGQTTGAYTLAVLALTSVQTAALQPGYYTVIITLADSTAPLSWGLLEVISAPSAVPNPTQDFLVSPAEVLGMVPDLTTADYLADLPRVITSATQAIRKYCSRNFTRTVQTKEFRPNYQGQIRLDEIPVNEVIRIATGREGALWITGPSNAQIANVRYSYTGDYDSGLVTTGLILTKTVNAVSTSTTLLFATYPMINQLSAAITALGWSARTTSTYDYWPSTELVGGDAAQGALAGSGCQLDVYSTDVSLERLDPNTGMVWLGYGVGANTGLDSPTWGPDYVQFITPSKFPAKCKVTYDAGFTTLPSPVVMAAVETVQAAFSRLATDQIILSETADAYSYTLRDQLDFIPSSAKHALAPYRIFNA